jgi:hypothetical protein
MLRTKGYAVAFLTEIRAYPNGILCDHHNRIASEMTLIDRNRCNGRSNPSIEVGRRTLWNNSISNWVPVTSPIVPSAVRYTAAEERATFCERVSTWWKSHMPNPIAGQAPNAVDPIRGLLEQELLQLQSREVSATESALLESTKIALNDDADPAIRTLLVQTYE